MPNCPPEWTDADRVLRAQTAAHTSWANTVDRTTRTAPGREGLLRKFEREVDPDEVLLPAERRKRAENLRRAHMARMSLAASKARRARQAGAE